MRALIPCFALCLVACSEQTQGSAEDVLVRVVDLAERPLPKALVWYLPRSSWERRTWIPAELYAYYCNPHELIRRAGTQRVADEDGAVRVPRDSMVAGELGQLAGVITTHREVDAAPRLVLDDVRWTIRVHDGDGKPVAGVPVECTGREQREADEQFEGMPLGLTDAAGRLVVRAPGSIMFAAEYIQVPSARANELPRFARLEVAGMYLEPHSQSLPLDPVRSGTVTLTMPPITKIEVRGPEWRGPLLHTFALDRTGKGQLWDGVTCWSAEGKCFGLVGVSGPGRVTPIEVRGASSWMHCRVEVPLLEAGKTFPVSLALEEGDAVVRARAVDAEGRPAGPARMWVLPRSDTVRTPWVWVDGEGNFALVLRPGTATDLRLELVVDSARDAALVRATAELLVEGLRAGERRDVGRITFGKK